MRLRILTFYDTYLTDQPRAHFGSGGNGENARKRGGKGYMRNNILEEPAVQTQNDSPLACTTKDLTRLMHEQDRPLGL